MNGNNSILDKIIQSQQIQEAYQFSPNELITKLLKSLSEKEKEIIGRRFGLNGGEKHTLEQIGKSFQITRERIRQIQSSAIRKVKEIEIIKSEIEAINHTISRLLQEYGGIMEETHFLNELLKYSEDNSANRQSTLFIASQLLSHKLDKIKPSDKLLNGWKLKVVSLDIVHDIIGVMEDIIKTQNKLLNTEQLFELFKNHEFYNSSKSQLLSLNPSVETDKAKENNIDKILLSHLNISKNINKNILGEWGLTEWQTISPKRMGDKIYLILRKIGKPLHFGEITEVINKTGFDKKIAYPATIHNELILDERYVLVGRGIYALKEWGYNPGTVSDVIYEILKKSPQSLDRDSVVNEVTKRRMVKESTIYLALTNKNKFKKINGKYALAEETKENA